MNAAERINRTERLPFVVWFGVGVSALLIGGFIYFAVFFVNKKISSLELNEIGDAVGGFSALLAFLWIVITTYLQTRELSLQREEIRVSNKHREDQNKEQRKSAEAAQQQYELLRSSQLFILIDRVHRIEDDAIHGLLSQIVLHTLPSLFKTSIYRSYFDESNIDLIELRNLLYARSYTDLLNVLSSRFSKPREEDLPQVMQELKTQDAMRDRIDSLLILFAKWEITTVEAGIHHQTKYDFGFALLDSNLKWLFGAREQFPTSFDRFGQQVEKLGTALEEMRASFASDAKQGAAAPSPPQTTRTN